MAELQCFINTHGAFRLLDMPGELRNKVYEALFTDIVARYNSVYMEDEKWNNNHLAGFLSLRKTCTAIKKEATSLFVEDFLPHFTFLFQDVPTLYDFAAQIRATNTPLSEARFALRMGDRCIFDVHCTDSMALAQRMGHFVPLGVDPVDLYGQLAFIQIEVPISFDKSGVKLKDLVLKDEDCAGLEEVVVNVFDGPAGDRHRVMEWPAVEGSGTKYSAHDRRSDVDGRSGRSYESYFVGYGVLEGKVCELVWDKCDIRLARMRLAGEPEWSAKWASGEDEDSEHHVDLKWECSGGKSAWRKRRPRYDYDYASS